MRSIFAAYCTLCRGLTTKAYVRQNGGRCRKCVEKSETTAVRASVPASAVRGTVEDL